jgi:hypothetical protein
LNPISDEKERKREKTRTSTTGISSSHLDRIFHPARHLFFRCHIICCFTLQVSDKSITHSSKFHPHALFLHCAYPTEKNSGAEIFYISRAKAAVVLKTSPGFVAYFFIYKQSTFPDDVCRCG